MTPSALYSYSFHQNPDWSRTFAGQPEILSYVRDTAEHFGVIPFIRFNSPVQHARWIDAQNQWQIETADTTSSRQQADFAWVICTNRSSRIRWGYRNSLGNEPTLHAGIIRQTCAANVLR
ncbi:MAG: hypothetical protein R3F38_18590 [Gammaproteobacteria bacterium]